MTSLQMRDHILDRLKVELKRIAFLSYDDYSFWGQNQYHERRTWCCEVFFIQQIGIDTKM